MLVDYIDSINPLDGHKLRLDLEIREVFLAHKLPDLPVQEFSNYLADFLL